MSAACITGLCKVLLVIPRQTDRNGGGEGGTGGWVGGWGAGGRGGGGGGGTILV